MRLGKRKAESAVKVTNPVAAQETNNVKFTSLLEVVPFALGHFNPETAPPWANSTVMACVQWAMRVFSAPLEVESLNEDRYELVHGHALSKLVNRPNEYYSGKLLMEGTVLSLLVSGNAYWLKLRNKSSTIVKELWYVPHTMITPVVVAGSYKIDYYTYRAGGQVLELAPEDVVHFRNGFDPYMPYMGLSPLTAILRSVLADNELIQYSHAVLQNFGVPGMIIAPKDPERPFEEGEGETIGQKLSKRFTGEGRGKTMILSAPIDIQAPGFSPKDIDISSMKGQFEAAICAVLGVHPAVVGLQVGLEHSTFSNMAEARVGAYESLIIPLQEKIADELDTQLLDDLGDTTNERCYFDLSKVRMLQEDDQAKRDKSVLLFQGGLIKRSEGRAMNGLDYDASDDVYITDIQAGNTMANAQEQVIKSRKAKMAEHRRLYERLVGTAEEPPIEGAA